MSIPADLRYSEDHEWVRLESDGTVVVGITHHAQDALGDVVYVELPDVGMTLEPGDAFGVVESVKSVSDLCAPLAGKVVEVNGALEDAPETVNSDPYHEGWICQISIADPEAFTAMMDSDQYAEFVAAESH